MKNKLLEALLLKTPPPQFQLLDQLLNLFSSGTYLVNAYIRGSIATNQYDRASDVDLVLVVKDSAYKNLIEGLDLLLAQHFVVLRSGWLDKIVPNFGGLGFVYLVANSNKLFQLDIYVIPLSSQAKIQTIPRATMVYSHSTHLIEKDEQSEQLLTTDLQQFISSKKNEQIEIDSLFTEFLIMAFLIKKRIRRQQFFLNYSETSMLWICLRQLMRHIWEPQLSLYGWYHFLEQGEVPSEVLAYKIRLQKIMLSNPVSSAESIKEAFQLFFELNSLSGRAEAEIKSVRTAGELVLEEFHD